MRDIRLPLSSLKSHKGVAELMAADSKQWPSKSGMQTYSGRPANLNRGSERIPIFRAAVDSIISARIREGHRQGILVLRSPCSQSIITAIKPINSISNNSYPSNFAVDMKSIKPHNTSNGNIIHGESS